MGGLLFLGKLMAVGAEHRSYQLHEGMHCYWGHGGVSMTTSDTAVGNLTVAQCKTACDNKPTCVAVSHDAGVGVGRCWIRSHVDTQACENATEWDTYVSPPADLAHQLKQQTDGLVAELKRYFPNLAISLAWKDSQRHVAVASGNVLGREVGPNDTFAYGSGTKPVTAVGVLRLIDSNRVQADDKAHKYIDPYLKAHGKPTLAQFFGEEVHNATVLDLIRMSSGIRDFEDSYAFDVQVLENGSKFWDYPYASMNFSVSPTNTGGGAPLICSPGNCTAYSSTGYEVAGLLLNAVLSPEKPWYEFDLGSAVFEDRSIYPTMSFPPSGRDDDKLSRVLTVPGASVADTWPKTTIYDQNPSVMGWTCGNMIASPSDVATFFYHTLNDEAHDSLISDASRAEMIHTEYLSVGWAAYQLKYGAGLMELQYGNSGHVFVQGHEGDTYGFLSSQGWVPEFKGAFSIATNVDNDYPKGVMACLLMQTISQLVHGANATLGCSTLASLDAVLV